MQNSGDASGTYIGLAPADSDRPACAAAVAGAHSESAAGLRHNFGPNSTVSENIVDESHADEALLCADADVLADAFPTEARMRQKAARERVKASAGGVAPNSDRAGPELEAPCH